MARLALSLLGSFHVTLDHHTVSSFAYDKVRALLAYLVVDADRPHRRETLAELLWPDQPTATARHSLSQALTTLRQALGDHTASPPYLLITRESVQWNLASDHVVDVRSFMALIDACQRHAHGRQETCAWCVHQFEQAVALYKGEFLAQFTIGDSAAFEEWTLLRREWLQQRVLSALAWLSEYHMERGTYELAAQYGRMEVALDPWREDAHRQLMRVFSRSGQRTAALRQYEQCRTLLAAELGIEPDVATTALYEQIRTGALSVEGTTRRDQGAMASSYLPLGSTAHLHNLPAPTMLFVGREREVAALTTLLADPECRLITLIGPGGIGKTRLSQQVAQTAIDSFAHGVCFVPLAPLGSSQQLVAALADALHLQFFGQDNPVAQLCAYLHEKQMLLLLDNVEHVLDGAAIVADLLQAAPQIKVLATSRERLNLRSEWVYEVEGLSVPEQDALDAIQTYSAVQLFVQSARRAQSRFDLRADDRRCIVQICRLAGGMPLAIELAAAWVPVLPCAEIAREIEKNVDFLTTSTRDLPERHRSVRAVFDHSWNLLGERERTVFRRLSVFRGGFIRAAAEHVADASLAGLAALVAKSLLRRTPDGRYEIHELLRQYGAAKLYEIAEEELQIRERHAAWYAEFLGQCAIRLKGSDQQAAIREIIAEMENIRAAWYWMTDKCNLALLTQSFDGLWLFFASHGNASEAGLFFEQTIARLEQINDLGVTRVKAHDQFLGRLYTGLGSMHNRLGNYARARSLLERSIVLFRHINAPHDLAFALHHLAVTMHLQGAYREEQALLYESIALSQAAGDQWLIGYSLNDLGLCLYLRGDHAEAQRHCTESLAIFGTLYDERGMAFALNNLGVIAASMGDYVEAERLHQASLAGRRAINDRWGIAMSLMQLGIVARAAARYEASRASLLDALRTAYDIRVLPLVLDILVELAHVLVITGEHRQAHTLLKVAMQHAALTLESRHKAEQSMTDMPILSDIPELDQAIATSIDALITTLLTPTAVEVSHA